MASQKDTMAQISRHNIIYSGLFWLVLEHFALCFHICALKSGMYRARRIDINQTASEETVWSRSLLFPIWHFKNLQCS